MCGICAVYGEDAFNLGRALLTKINHRGQDGAGLFVYPSKKKLFSGQGLVNEVLKDNEIPRDAKISVGQVRYPTEGEVVEENTQPIVKTIDNVQYVIAHNGEIVGFRNLVEQWNLESEILSYYSDTHLIPYAIARSSGSSLEEKVINGLSNLNPAWSICMAIIQKNHEPLLVIAKDPYGFRPLSITTNDLGAFAVSENSNPPNQNHHTRELERGEIVFVDEKGIRSHIMPQERKAPCIFEHIYFHFPKGEFGQIDVTKARHNLGRQLAIEEREQGLCIQNAIVVYAPDSSHVAAIGYSEEAKLPLRPGIIRRHYQSNPRAFMAKPSKRAALLEAKYEVIPIYVEGKKVVLIDDSIVRGNASQYLVSLLKNGGAKEVHIRITSAPIMHPCTYGIDMKTYKELIASERSTEEIRQHIGADSLLYLSLQGMHKAIGLSPKESCNACFSGDYPFK
ncbi:MAG TPA: class II glutamine amidotransferase [Candidatus Nanoarchaeia archaeon]|nr:class II glutamine amidotransferase [Candidatus Nanoarchaeia archaeon]